MQTRLVTDYLDKTAKKYPEKIAFVDSKRSITFSQLQNESYKISQHIIDLKIFKKPVCIFLDKSVECIAAFMGTAYSGNFYTPIDVTMPSSRIQKIFDTLHPNVIITDAEHISNLNGIYGDYKVLLYDEIQSSEVNIEKIYSVTNKIIDTDILYVLFTSGSTGIPKGVSIPHCSVISYSEWFATTFNIDDTTVFGNQTPFYFSMSVSDIFQTIKNGCTFYIIPKKLFSFPIKLLEFVSEHNINTIYWVPSALCLVANLKALGKRDISCLKKILFAGEPMPTKQYNMWKKCVPNAMFANLFGPTETVDICCYYILDRNIDDDKSIPIGTRCSNCDCLVFDENNNLIDTKDVIGELCVRGSFLSFGYYNNPEKTREVFVQNPLNSSYPELIYRTGDLVHYNEFGELMYDCRKDFQIKHMGHRIELGEIEVATSSVEEVLETCCLYDTGRDKIVLFFSGNIDENALIANIKEKVPSYMIPEIVHKMNCLPHNQNGKVDRVLLKTKMEDL